MAAQTETRFGSSIPPPSPPPSDGEGKRGEGSSDMATRAAGEEVCGREGPTPPGSEPDKRDDVIEEATELGRTSHDSDTREVGTEEPHAHSPSTEPGNSTRAAPDQSREAANDSDDGPLQTPAPMQQKPVPPPDAMARAPPQRGALDPEQDVEAQYLEPPTPTQPLQELSPIPMAFPLHIHTSIPRNEQGSPTSPANPNLLTPTANDPTTTSPITSPPYWPASEYEPTSDRPNSMASADFKGITLCDNEIDARNAACWAKSVTIQDYIIVNGTSTIPSVFRPALARVGASSQSSSRSGGGVVHTATTSPIDETRSDQGGWIGGNVKATLGMGGIGAFVAFNVAIETLEGGTIVIQRRFSEFDTLRNRLVMTFPRYEKAMPELPPKSLVSRFRPKFLEQRRRGLEYFLSCVLLNPQFAGSPVTKEFIFARSGV